MELLQSLDLGTVLSIIFGAIATFGGAFWLKSKGKLKQVATLAFDVYELLNEVEKALGDDKLSKEEIVEIKSMIKKIKADFKLLINKTK